MNSNKTEDNRFPKGWLDKVLEQASKAVEAWPEWMKQPEMRYPMDKHKVTNDPEGS